MKIQLQLLFLVWTSLAMAQHVRKEERRGFLNGTISTELLTDMQNGNVIQTSARLRGVNNFTNEGLQRKTNIFFKHESDFRFSPASYRNQNVSGLINLRSINKTVTLALDSVAPLTNQTDFFDRFMHVEGQMTAVYQTPLHTSFTRYNGRTDLAENWKSQVLIMATLPFYLNPWKNCVINITPEYSGGNGLGDGTGISSYPNALYAFPQAKPYILRAQIQQLFDLKTFADGSKNTLEVRAGRFILQEMFNCNQWAYDPKKDFLNFNHTMMSAWDAATTAYGYTHGVAARLRMKKNIFSGALVTVNAIQGDITTDWNVRQGQSINLQYCRALALWSKTLNIHLLAYNNRTFSGAWKDLPNDTNTIGTFSFPDSLKAYHNKTGIGLDADLALDDETGVFVRFSFNDGRSESMGYTQADQAFNIGFSKGMSRFKRPNDNFGLAFSANGLSKGHRAYVNAGGNGFMLAGGPINYGYEMAFETYYRLNLFSKTDITFNYQLILNPAYNKDYMRLDAFAVRLQFEF